MRIKMLKRVEVYSGNFYVFHKERKECLINEMIMEMWNKMVIYTRFGYIYRI